jgi:hypothetical protein
VLRHTVDTDPIRGGTDVVTVAELMRHASLDSTWTYTLPTDEDLDAAVARLTVDRQTGRPSFAHRLPIALPQGPSWQTANDEGRPMSKRWMASALLAAGLRTGR